MENPEISGGFISAVAAGSDWRDAVKKILGLLGPDQNENGKYSLGFLYVTEPLAADLQSILSFLSSATGIADWTGTVGFGVCGTGEEHIDVPAIAVMLAALPPEDFHLFPSIDLDPGPAMAALERWQQDKDPMLVLVHGAAQGETEPALPLGRLEDVTGGFLLGGLSTPGGEGLQIAGDIYQGGVSGVVFSQEIAVASMLTQGCVPLGPVHAITRCEENVIMELDGKKAFDVFADDLKMMAKQDVERGQCTAEPEEENIFAGEVHVAFPVAGSDRQDYQVRNIMGIDPEKGWMAVAQTVQGGEQMMFVRRDDNTVRADLSRALLELRERLTDERGVFAPRAALYISCAARAQVNFGGDAGGGEMALLREILGDIPIVGFYAGGEISNRRIYAHTAVLTVFL